MKATLLRKKFKNFLSGNTAVVIPGAFNAICAKFVEAHGFKATYISGSATSGGAFALPDIGIVDLSETLTQAQLICNAVDLPVIADADTGFGELLHIPRTISRFEETGLCGIHLEDQVFPKRCGHLDGKDVIPKGDMVKKIKRAVESRQDENFLIIARSDSHSIHGFDDMLDRLKTYRDAGADVVFPEALGDLKSFEKVVQALDCPVLANMTEFGKTPFFTVKEYENTGIKIVLFPVTLMRVAMGAIDRALTSIKQTGHQGKLVDEMYSRKDFYQLIDYDSYKNS